PTLHARQLGRGRIVALGRRVPLTQRPRQWTTSRTGLKELCAGSLLNKLQLLAGQTPNMIDDLWYKNGVIYCLSVGTYMDANGDGVGDFKGLLRRLDYLHGLGITAIWLMPFQPSPGKDDGYDISDYYGVDPRYGTLGDFVEFTHGCKQRGIRIIIDLVVNHTSDQHSWFREARRSSESRFRGWYVWSDKRPASANTGMVFPGVQKSTWSHDKEAGAWYFHRFYDFQ